MAGIFATLGGFLLIICAIAVALIVVGAITEKIRMDKDILWKVFWATLISGAILIYLGDFAFAYITR